MGQDKLMKDLLGWIQEGKTEAAVRFIQETENLDVCKTVHKKSGDSLLHDLATVGATEVIEAILIKYPETDINIRNFDGKTGLHDACQQGHFNTVKLLLKHQAKVNTLKKADWSPAMLAVTHPGRLEILKLLVTVGADLNLVNKDGWTVFQICARSGDLAVLQYILSKEPDIWKIVSKNGRSSLHTASLAGHTNVIQFLLDLGADPNSTDSCGSTPFMDSIRSGNMETLETFIRSPRLLADTCDLIGRSAVHVAAQAGQGQAILRLKQMGLDLEGKTNAGQTPLHSAAREGQTEVVELLLQEGVDLNHRDENGRSALFLAVSGQHAECAQVLLQAGADPAGDSSGTSLISLARKPKLRELMEPFLEEKE